MKRKHLWWIALVLPGMATAAGFDCGKASTAGEKAVCASPELSALDGTLSDMFRAVLKANPGLADALRLDQRHWLATRDDTAWTFSSGAAGDTLPKVLADLYRRRIDVLRGIDGKPSPPLDALKAGLAKRSAGADDVLDALAREGVLTLATDRRIDDPKRLPFEPDAALRKALDDAGDRLVDRVLPGSPVSSVYSIGGTASCYVEAPYRLDGKRAVAIAMPPVWGDGDCMLRHALVRIGDDVAALRMEATAADEVTLAASRWDGGRFAPGQTLSLRFDHALSLEGSACAPARSPCDDFATQAMSWVARYDLRPQAGTIDRLPKGADKADYEAAVAAARASGGLLDGKNGAGFPVLPVFGSRVASGRMTGYDSEATPFPLMFRGETLMGLIGHGHVGWRTNGDWMVSAWRLKNGGLEPVASAYVEVKRGRLLFSSVVPSAPRAEH
ncbi:lysozyme inhibitor LprI family protein [Luteibacter sp. CQ10]|uniref:lysozyme inhibitor LprI family protein n=1 Tax=Luteibacter sp. CQ10 TaxID=2805821 RepID=UPI0034A5469B